MSLRIYPYDPDAVCRCGKVGAYDVMGDDYCVDCLGALDEYCDDDIDEEDINDNEDDDLFNPAIYDEI